MRKFLGACSSPPAPSHQRLLFFICIFFLSCSTFPAALIHIFRRFWQEIFYILLLFIVMVNPKAQRSLIPCLGNFHDWNPASSGRVLKDGSYTWLNSVVTPTLIKAKYHFCCEIMALPLIYISSDSPARLWLLKFWVQEAPDSRSLRKSLLHMKRKMLFWITAPKFTRIWLKRTIFCDWPSKNEKDFSLSVSLRCNILNWII